MAQFRFSDLPTELRLLIWEAALYQETRNRLAIIDVFSQEVTPVKQLISPLLTINRESRQVAKALYTRILGVWRYSQCSYLPPEQFAGVLHLSLDKDIFVTGMTDQDCTRDYDIPNSAEAQVPYYYKTESISDKDRGRNDEVPADLVKEKRRSSFILDLFTDNGASKPLRLILLTDGFRKEEESRYRTLWDVGYDRDDTFN
ncbi:Cytochrome c oxidase subunit 6B [Hypoxylon texense]